MDLRGAEAGTYALVLGTADGDDCEAAVGMGIDLEAEIGAAGCRLEGSVVHITPICSSVGYGFSFGTPLLGIRISELLARKKLRNPHSLCP